jgi:hydroxyacylglutathione hydrolase
MHASLQIVTVRCLQDNYAYLVHDPARATTVLIDAPEAAPIRAELDRRGWRLADILLTHHHWDHVDGLEALRAEGARVWGAKADAHRLPRLDHAFDAGQSLSTGAGDIAVIDAPGHTLGHVAFHLARADALFCGDSLMVHGCGRLFEGTPAQMFDTITRLDRLPETTRIFSGHDYAAANLAFAARFAPDADALAHRRAELAGLADDGRPVTGVTLAQERLLNPYLRCHLPQVAAAAGLPHAPAPEVFARIRALKDAA